MQTPKKNFTIVPHNIMRCGELLTHRDFRTFLLLLSWYDYETEKGSVFYSTLAEGQKNQEKLDYVDRGFGNEKNQMQRNVRFLKRKGVISILETGGQDEQGRKMMSFSINWSFFSQPMVASCHEKPPLQMRPMVVSCQTYGTRLSLPMVASCHQSRQTSTTEKKPERRNQDKKPERENLTPQLNIESKQHTHKIKEISTLNFTQHDKELSDELNFGLRKQGIETKDVSTLINLWRTKYKISLNQAHINLICQATRNSKVRNSYDLFKKVKTSSENVFPLWKTLIEGVKALTLDIHPLAIKFLENWMQNDLNHFQPRNKFQVAYEITPAIKELEKQYEEKLEKFLNMAIEMRKKDFWPSELEKQGPDFLFKKVFKSEIFNIEKLNNGDFLTYPKNTAPKAMKEGETSSFLESIGQKITL